jgi:hypothetical protein
MSRLEYRSLEKLKPHRHKRPELLALDPKIPVPNYQTTTGLQKDVAVAC